MVITGGDRVLIVVAHPDDDVLGLGGTSYALAQRGIHVQACILAGAVDARKHRPVDADLHSDIHQATRIIGMEKPLIGNFPNIQMNTVPHLSLVQFVENAMEDSQANIIFTTHPSDLNDDHRQASRATQAAARLHQRGGSVPPLKLLAFTEVLSSTDWNFGGEAPVFRPTMFTPIGEDGLAAKLQALEAYRGVMRPYPHPRSQEGMRSLATLRGAQSGIGLAEAFEIAHLTLSMTQDRLT